MHVLADSRDPRFDGLMARNLKVAAMNVIPNMMIRRVEAVNPIFF
jgi:hypothetical protein